MGNINTTVTFHGFTICDQGTDRHLVYTDGVQHVVPCPPRPGTSFSTSFCKHHCHVFECQDSAGSDKFVSIAIETNLGQYHNFKKRSYTIR